MASDLRDEMMRTRRHPDGRPWMKGLVCTALAVALLGGCSGGDDSEQASSVEGGVANRLQAALEDAMADDEEASIAVVAVDIAGRRWVGRAGGASTRDSVNTSFLLASVTKTYVAALALDLVDDGTLDLDDTADLDGVPNGATVRQLLNHTSGLPHDYVGDALSSASAFAEAVRRGPPAVCARGSCHNYSDLNYLALGLVLEARTESSIGELLDRFLADHGLAHTAYAGDGDFPPDTLFDYVGLEISDCDGSAHFARRTGAAGAMVATADDLVQWRRSLFARDVLESATLAEMVDPTTTMALPCQPESCVGRYGLGVEVMRVHGRTAYGHEGSTGAFVAHLPDDDVTIAVLTNAFGTGRRIAWRLTEAMGIEDHADVWTIDRDGDHLARLIDTAGIDGGPAWSPDGASIVFGSTRDGQPELYVMDADGGNERRLTDHPSADHAGRFSPDGSRILFASDRAGNFDIWTIAVDGSDPQQVTTSPDDERLASYAPDGRIVFEVGSDGDRDLTVINGDGTHPTRFELPGDQWYGAWSPTGDRIAHVQSGEGIWTINADGTDARPLPDTLPGDRFPAWGPGDTIAFVDRVGDLWVTQLGGSDRRRLTLTVEEEFGPWWSPDGRTLVFPSDRAPAPSQ